MTFISFCYCIISRNKELIKNIKLFDYKGSIQNQSNVLKFNNEIITIETESLNLGIYFLSINSNHVPIKILVTE